MAQLLHEELRHLMAELVHLVVLSPFLGWVVTRLRRPPPPPSKGETPGHM